MKRDTNVDVELAAAPDAEPLAALHGAILPGSRLSLFGHAYLASCYRYFIRSPDELVFVAHADLGVVGGAFVSLAPGSLSRRLIGRTPLLWYLALRPLGRGARQILADLLQPASAPAAPDQPELIAIFVAPKERGRGVGELICRAVERELIRRKFASYVVHTERDPDNRAIAFYRRLGFAPPDDGGPPRRLIHLTKTLP